jgi:hypothetical protein
MSQRNGTAEVAVLGSMLLDAEAVAEVLPKLCSEDFDRTAHRLIYDAALRLFEEKATVDVVLLRDELERGGNLRKAGGEEYLAEMLTSVPSAAHAGHYAKIVRDNSRKRKIVNLARELRYRAEQEDVPALLARLRAGLAEVDQGGGGGLSVETLADLFAADIPEPENIVGRRVLDAGGLLVLCGPGGVGKSFLVLDLALRLARGARSWLDFALDGHPRRVLLLHGEGTDAMLRERALRLVEGLPKNGADDLLVWTPGRGERIDLLDAGSVELLDRLARDVQVVVVDPLCRFHFEDEVNSTFRRLVDQLLRLQVRGVAVVLVHHVAKAKEHVPVGDADRGRGGSALRDAADSFLVFEPERTDPIRRTLFFPKLRHGPAIAPMILTQDERGAFAFEGYRDAPGVVVADGEVERAIVEAGRALTLRDLQEAIGATRSAVGRAIDREPPVVKLAAKRGRADLYGVPAMGVHA